MSKINVVKKILGNTRGILAEEHYKGLVSKKWKELERGLPVVDILDLFPRFEETVNPFSLVKGGNILPIDTALLTAIAKKSDSCRYLEIGTLCGGGVANVAKVAKECVTVDLPPAEMRKKLKRSDRFFKEGCGFFSKSLGNVKHILCDSKTLDFSTLDGKFDLIFIDGGHEYQTVKKDTENAFKMLRDNSSVIVWHDYKYDNLEDIRWEVFAGVLDGCPKEKINNLYYVSDTICAIYLEGDSKIKKGESPPEIPDKRFSIKISAQSL